MEKSDLALTLRQERVRARKALQKNVDRARLVTRANNVMMPLDRHAGAFRPAKRGLFYSGKRTEALQLASERIDQS